ncbi:O-methyltransferase [Paenibacillus psychroresistens]|uniref:O-methyltransferase n=1 Tax=Paenibacillus psychroresistens TaxID=1778678 RepID=A0A6B8RQ98_9BACL|nr:O-methyltransferase [Paenibacillus psychroresistens]QGQ97468.1 O-methyltransferase [Paenibacillus psychroresistens]
MSVMSNEEYVESLFAADVDLNRAIEGIRAKGMPEISIAPGYGRLLTLLVQASGAQNILEIGALGGYSGICLARGLQESGKLLSLELQQDYADVAFAHLQQAGLGDKVAYRIGDAMVTLPELVKEGARFDFFFIDADKGSYPEYLDYAIKLANPGAIIVGDNSFMHGRTKDPAENGNSVKAVRRFNERMATDPQLESTILPAYDGLAIARVKG